MKEENAKDIEQYLADTIIGRSYEFSVGEQHFAIYPVTLGKFYILQRQLETLAINQQNIMRDVSLEALRLAKDKKKECLSIITYHTCKDASEVFDNALITERIALFEKELSDEDIAALMILVLTSDKTEMFMKHLGITKEIERLNTVMNVKSRSDKNNLTFGGKSIYGSMIDAACERYGWTKEYVVWGIDYTSLRLMLADKVNSVYCSDDEIEKMPAWVRGNGNFLKADDPKNREKIKNMSWK